MKNIYITDLDHTFLRNDLSISNFTRNTWNAFAKNNIMGIATARTFKKTQQFLKDVEVNAPMILLDGALIATQNKKIIDTKFISKDIADNIIDIGAKFGIFPFILALADKHLNEVFLYSDICNKTQTQVIKHYSKDDHLKECKNIRALNDNFKVVYMGDKFVLSQLAQELEDEFGDTLKYILAPEAYTKSYFLTILHKDADKSHGILSVSEYVGFDLNKLTVFGDNFNDLGMFNLAKISVAMANAQQKVKENASIVLEFSNDEDGVAKYLQGLNK
jgi:Cof subfamily protein (haloacid dehalogenase superfamily)